MKILSFSRISFVVGLALGIMVLYAGAAPMATSADLLIGGWYPSSANECCTGTDAIGDDSNCPSGFTWPGVPPGDWLGCAGGDLTICTVGGTGSKCCGAVGDPICNDNYGEGSPICNDIHDASCTTANCS